jgi:hypothetical protein
MNEILTQEHINKGLSTVVHFDYLYLLDPKECPITKFYKGIDPKTVRKEADKYLTQFA